ncbi:MAG TPA: F0F1 ATP synthase subunit B, partial [Pricia sp.]|nr:F0F1 ATP synthase subunit B [Pricia sp.]
MDLVTPGIGLIFWSTLIFIILLILLKKYAWKPILDAVKTREESIQNALLSAEEAKKEMQNLQTDNQRILKEARAEREAMLKEAREIKDKMIADSKEQAKVEGDKMIKQAQSAIESEKKAA